MKKLLVALLVTAMAVTSLAGCGDKKTGGNDGNTTPTQNAGGENAGGENAGGTPSGDVTDITLKVWCPQNQVDTGIMEQQQAAFAAEHPEYNITWVTEIVGEDKCAENVLRDVGAAADVFMFASDQLPQMVEAGAIARLGGTTEEMVREIPLQSLLWQPQL